MVNLIHEFLDYSAARLPDKAAVITDEGLVTYSELSQYSRSLAAYFHEVGVRRGDRIAILLPNSIPVVAALMAASRLDAVFFILNPAIKPYHLRYILEDALPALVVTTRERRESDHIADYCRVLTVEDHWEEAVKAPPVSPVFPGISSDTACLIYTSGSTGKPKAVISTHLNIIFATEAIQQCIGVRESDVVGNFLPMAFDYGLYQVFLTFQAGATLALGHDAHVGPGFLKKLGERKITGLPVVPSLAYNLIRLAKRMPDQVPRLRFVTNTGAHLPRSYIKDIRLLFPGCAVYVMFGLTECKRVSILPPADYERKADSVGKPLPQTECLIVGPDRQPLPAGQVGELVVRGPHVMLGYWRAPELTAKRFGNWGPGLETALFTGDLCSMDSDGYLYFHGRSDDIYKQGGYRVSAQEVEAAACDIPGVRQAALLPPEDDSGAMLFVVGDLSVDEIFDGVKLRLEDYKLPAQIVVVDDLPLTSNGKMDKKQLKSRLTEQQ
jgi:amino acid adenylation domain-containing protein